MATNVIAKWKSQYFILSDTIENNGLEAEYVECDDMECDVVGSSNRGRHIRNIKGGGRQYTMKDAFQYALLKQPDRRSQISETTTIQKVEELAAKDHKNY